MFVDPKTRQFYFFRAAKMRALLLQLQRLGQINDRYVRFLRFLRFTPKLERPLTRLLVAAEDIVVPESANKCKVQCC